MPELDEKVASRLEELIRSGDKVKQTVYDPREHNPLYQGDYGVDYELAYQWGTSCLDLLDQVFGKDSAYYANFETQSSKLHLYNWMIQALGILRAAKNDYEHGHLFNARILIEAEVFDDFLDQGAHLLDSGYYQPAAVVIGSVLEDGLRKLCMRNEIALSDKPKLDSMNNRLAKQDVYNKLTQKRITMLADIRNKAAHGEWDEFTKADVEDMLRSVRQFMETHFA